MLEFLNCECKITPYIRNDQAYDKVFVDKTWISRKNVVRKLQNPLFTECFNALEGILDEKLRQKQRFLWQEGQR